MSEANYRFAMTVYRIARDGGDLMGALDDHDAELLGRAMAQEPSGKPRAEASVENALAQIAHGLFEGGELCRSYVSDITVREKYRQAHTSAMLALNTIRAALSAPEGKEAPHA